MAMTADEWLEFIATGSPPMVHAATLSADLCRIIGSTSPEVYIRHDYALKLTNKHGVGIDEFPILSIAIDLGRVISDQPRRLSFYFFQRAVFSRWFQVTIKSNREGTELWVLTFHRVKAPEVARIYRRCPILRPDETLEAEK